MPVPRGVSHAQPRRRLDDPLFELACLCVELNPQRKLFVSVLALAVTALLVDRVILGGGGGPATATASIVDPGARPAQTPAEPAQGTPAAATPAATSATLAQRLSQAAGKDRSGFSDAFDVSGGWMPVQPAAPAHVPTPATKVDPLKHFKLSAVAGRLAVINGRPFEINKPTEIKTPDGTITLTLLDVDSTARAARVLIGEQEFRLELQTGKDEPGETKEKDGPGR